MLLALSVSVNQEGAAARGSQSIVAAVGVTEEIPLASFLHGTE